jgi:hypothetical protein
MADALLPLNFVVNTKQLAFTETNPQVFKIPTLFQEDNLLIHFKALKQISILGDGRGAGFLEKLPLAGYGLQICVGSAGSIKANVNTFDVIDNYTVQGFLNLATSDINNALAGANEVQLTFEIILKLGGLPYRGAYPVLLKKSVALAGALVPPPGDTALGALDAERLYVPQNDSTGFTMRNKAGTKRAFVYLDDDGMLRADPL